MPNKKPFLDKNPPINKLPRTESLNQGGEAPFNPFLDKDPFLDENPFLDKSPSLDKNPFLHKKPILDQNSFLDRN